MRASQTIFVAGCIALSLLILSTRPPAGDAAERVIVLRPGAVLDVEAGRRLSGKLVVVRGDRIEAIRDLKEPLPPDAEVIDLPGATLLPGLIDAHVHLAWAGSGAAGRLPGSDEARATLDAGSPRYAIWGRPAGPTSPSAMRSSAVRSPVPGC